MKSLHLRGQRHLRTFGVYKMVKVSRKTTPAGASWGPEPACLEKKRRKTAVLLICTPALRVGHNQ
jgi:hypothetical protein